MSLPGELATKARKKLTEKGRRAVARLLGRIFGKADDDPIGSWGGKDPEELTRQYVDMSEKAGHVEVGSAVRPRASRTTGARFDHYPIIAQGSGRPLDLVEGLRGPVATGRSLMKEILFLAFVEDSDGGRRLEEQLAVLHPHLDPQYMVVIVRVAPGDRGPWRLGGVELSAPALPVILAFEAPDAERLVFRSASVGGAEGEDKLRAVLLETLMRGSPHGPGAGGVCAQLSGVTVSLR